MINIIEIKDLDNNCCRCCRTRDSNKTFYEIEFLYEQKQFTSSTHIKLCENCLEELFDKSMEVVLQNRTKQNNRIVMKGDTETQ